MSYLVRLISFIAWLGISIGMSQEPTPFVLDQTDPKSVVEAVFYAAKSGDLTILKGLSDPKMRGSDDTRLMNVLWDTALTNDSQLLALSKEFGSRYDSIPIDIVRKELLSFLAQMRVDFKLIFENGKIDGIIKFSDRTEGIENVPIAWVPIEYFNLNKQEMTKQHAQLIQIDGIWYFLTI